MRRKGLGWEERGTASGTPSSLGIQWTVAGSLGTTDPHWQNLILTMELVNSGQGPADPSQLPPRQWCSMVTLRVWSAKIQLFCNFKGSGGLLWTPVKHSGQAG